MLALWPENARAHAALAEQLQADGELPEALAHHAQAAALDPKNADYPFRQGRAAFGLHDLPAAESAFREAVRRDPLFAQGWKALGVAVLEQGRREEALLDMRRALELDPGMTDAPRMRELLGAKPVSPPR
jgi:tetratricopeptide (TPR) repeat protein